MPSRGCCDPADPPPGEVLREGLRIMTAAEDIIYSKQNKEEGHLKFF